MSLYGRLLGIPFVYLRIRPLIVGGIDMTPAYRNLDAGEDDVIMDIGCGPGDALTYLPRFRSLHGFDTDEIAIAHARNRAAGRSDVQFTARAATQTDLDQIKPTRVMMCGLLHHLDDQQATELLSICARTPSVKRIATQDVVFLPGQRVSNLYARLDRGKHVRTVAGYRALAAAANLELQHEEIVRCHPTRGLALYLLMSLNTREPS